MRSSKILVVVLAMISLSLPACQMHEEKEEAEHQTIVATTPIKKDITITRQYVCQIHSQRHINVCALSNGYLQEIKVKEGQAVEKGAVMFKILPTLYQAKYDAKVAEANHARLERNYSQKLLRENVVSPNELALYEAKLKRAEAEAKLAEAELNFTEIKAPFNGIVDRLLQREGSLIKEGEVLTTLSDNSLMWVYFNVPEARYLEYMHATSEERDSQKIELLLANGSKFDEPGKITTIEAKFNNETGNIPFRADFPNPNRLLRHGQTGTILVHRPLHNALVIPQRATFEILNKRYVYVIDKDGKPHQEEIIVEHEQDDIFIIKEGGIGVNDKIILEGVRQVQGHEDEKVEYEFCKPEDAIANQKQHAE